MELYEKSLKTLELPSVLEILAQEAVSGPAKNKAMELRPTSDASEANTRLNETSAACSMMTVSGSPTFSGIKDIRSSLARADIGGSLNMRELLDIAGVLRCARLVRAYQNGQGKTDIDYLFRSLMANRFLEERITASIPNEEEVADAASSELADIRRKMRAASARVRDALQKIISSPAYSKALQEPIITTRSDRYVVPVKAEHKSAVQGLVHDVSSSGATLFIEPMAAVKANNELRELRAAERLEIERILAELSAECAAHMDDITCDFNVLVQLDLIFAKAKLSNKLACTRPELSETQLRLKRARHPLLDKKTAVPIDVELGDNFDTLVITGPNTGGKTVTLKTLGLLTIMALCGLHIPALDGSRVPVLDRVLADIGDEQSIEQSLSTFSSHMTNIVGLLEHSDERTLLLFDELGAGTDPTEGAALAISIIEHARRLGAIVAATTHYAEIKVYATNTRGVQNASCEFDVETLRPTYKLLIGIPGKSNAFAISERLGLSAEIIADARGRVGEETASLQATIEKLELQRQSMERDRLEAEKTLARAQQSAREADALRRELSVRLEKSDERARREAQSIILDARRTADAVFAELEELRRSENDESDHQRKNEARAELRRRLNAADEQFSSSEGIEMPTEKSARPVEIGDVVEILSMGVRANVIEISSDRNLTLQAGIMRVTAREDEVLLIENAQKAETASVVQRAAAALRTQVVSPELDIRGMMTDEAVPVMERYLDSAAMSKLTMVTIIHGKGTGALRQAVQRSLKSNRQVKKYRLGRYGEGEAGVTIVELN